jgi:hypothetical protein
MKKLPLSLITVALIALPSAVSAQATVTWLGGTGDGNDPANWDTGVRPTSSDTIIINGGTIDPFATSDGANFTGTLNLNDGTLTGQVGNATAGRVNGSTYNIGDGVGASSSAVYTSPAFQRDGGAVIVNILSDGFMEVNGNYNRRGGPSTTTTVDGGTLKIDGVYVQGNGTEQDNLTVRNGGTVILGDGTVDDSTIRSGSLNVESNSNLTGNEFRKDNDSVASFNIFGAGSNISLNQIGAFSDGENGTIGFNLASDGLSSISVVQDFTDTGDFSIGSFTTGWEIDLAAADGLGTYTDTDPIVLFDFLDAGVDQTDLNSIAGSLLWTDEGTIAGATVADGGTVEIGLNEFTLNYTDVDTTGGQITLTLIPEPSTLSFLVVIGLLFVGSRRFSRRA